MEVKNKKEFLKLRKQITLDSDKIPKNTPYCYTIDRDRIKNDKTLKDGELPIIMCPYYVWGKKDTRGCLYTKVYSTFDILLWDQCKICGGNE